MNALALFYFFGWRTAIDSPRFQVARSDRGESEYCAFAYFDSRRNAGAGADPCVGTHLHCVSKEREGWVIEVVGCAAHVGVLREDGVRTEPNGRGIVDLCAVARSHLVFADQIPRSPNARARIEVAVRSDFRAKEAQ